MRFLLDENVPDSLALFFQERGFEVLLARDSFASGTPDQLLTFAAETEGLVIVTKDKDFRRLRDLLPQGHQRRIATGAGYIILSGKIPQAATRLAQEWDLIEFDYERSRRDRRRFIVRITNTGIQFTSNSST